MTGITDHLGQIRVQVAEAAGRSGRSADAITLLAVTKGHPPLRIAEALAAGIVHLGENYLQEALPKLDLAGGAPVWHFIGRIQSNKTREIATRFAWAQSVASGRTAERLSAQRPHYGDELHVCIQLRPERVGPGRSVERRGCARTEVPALAALIEGLPRVRLRGLMLLPHAGLDAGDLRAEYGDARRLFEQLVAKGHELDTLSMGMSEDFNIAIEEGSTMVRIGTALFGPRP